MIKVAINGFGRIGRVAFKVALEKFAKEIEIVGGGDTVGFLGRLGLLDKFSFVSTGGGAMLELLTKGVLPTIEALNGQDL